MSIAIAESDVQKGAVVLIDDQARIVKRLVRHPAGTIVQWEGKGDYATTHNSLDYVRAAGVIVRR